MAKKQKPTTQPQPPEPNPAWVEFFAEALRLQALLRAKRAAKAGAIENTTLQVISSEKAAP